MEDDDSQKVDSISNVYASIYSNNENFRTLFDEIEIGTDYINISKETKTKQTLLEGSFTDEGLGTALIISNRLFLLCFPTLRNPIVTYQYNEKERVWKDKHLVNCKGKIPSPRKHFSATQFGNFIFIFGGGLISTSPMETSFSNELYVFDSENYIYSLRNLIGNSIPTGRFGHSAANSGRFLYIFGGLTSLGSSNELYRIDTGTMMCEIIKCKGDIPQPRFFHTSCIIGNKLYLFGGCNQKSQIFNDFYFLEFGSFNWVKINYETSLNPAPRFGHSMISIGIRLFIFGGKSERDQDCGDLSVFDTISLNWNHLNALDYMKGVSISPRFFHLSVSFQSKYILIISGKMSNQGKISKLSDFCIIDTDIIPFVIIPPGTHSLDFLNLLESKLFSDLTVKCNDGNAFAHKLILQARIQNFCNDFQVDEETSLISVDTTCQVFQSFLQLIYTDTVKLSPEQNELFCKFVSQYNLNRVEKLNLEIESVLEEVMVSSLSVDMMKLLSTSLKFTDIKFHITEGNHIVSSYKSILAIRCSYFRAIFNFHQAPSNKQEQILEISNISLPTFQAALHYLYTDTVTINGEIAIELLQYASFLMLDRLKCMCEDFLIRNIDQDNVFLILPIAKVYSQPLLSTCFSFIKKNFETFQKSSIFVIHANERLMKEIQTICN